MLFRSLKTSLPAHIIEEDRIYPLSEHIVGVKRVRWSLCPPLSAHELASANRPEAQLKKVAEQEEQALLDRMMRMVEQHP